MARRDAVEGWSRPASPGHLAYAARVNWLIRASLFVAGLAAIFWIMPAFGRWAPLAHAIILLASMSLFLFLTRERD